MKISTKTKALAFKEKKPVRTAIVFENIPMKHTRGFNFHSRVLSFGLPPAFMLVSCVAYSSALKMEATCSSETSVNFHRTARSYIPEDRILNNHCCENLKSYLT
jgi:hypothetical protein